MKISAYNNEDRTHYQVWFNGKCATHVMVADDHVGYIITPMRDANGEIMVNRLYGTIKTQCQFGEVTIIDKRMLPVPANCFTIREIGRAFGLPEHFLRMLEWLDDSRSMAFTVPAELFGRNRHGKSVLVGEVLSIQAMIRMTNEVAKSAEKCSVILDDCNGEVEKFIQAIDQRTVRPSMGVPANSDWRERAHDPWRKRR